MSSAWRLAIRLTGVPRWVRDRIAFAALIADPTLWLPKGVQGVLLPDKALRERGRQAGHVPGPPLQGGYSEGGGVGRVGAAGRLPGPPLKRALLRHQEDVREGLAGQLRGPPLKEHHLSRTGGRRPHLAGQYPVRLTRQKERQQALRSELAAQGST